MTEYDAPPGFSVIVASRERPSELARCLTAIRELDHPAFEIIVVGCPAAADVVERTGGGQVEFLPFDEANLSKARNLGIHAARGDFCAFIDDDAVPVQLWLRHHEMALHQFRASASVGFVRGPDGVRFQSRFDTIDPGAETFEEAFQGDTPFLPDPGPERAVKLVGTNMVIRREVLKDLGGFDPAYRYHLEDSDISLRLRYAGHLTVVAPLAEVCHGLAASARRTSRRVPRDLTEIARSTALFLRRHYSGDVAAICQKVRSRERARLIRAMVDGRCEPRDVTRLLAMLDQGWAEGERLTLSERRTQITVSLTSLAGASAISGRVSGSSGAFAAVSG